MSLLAQVNWCWLNGQTSNKSTRWPLIHLTICGLATQIDYYYYYYYYSVDVVWLLWSSDPELVFSDICPLLRLKRQSCGFGDLCVCHCQLIAFCRQIRPKRDPICHLEPRNRRKNRAFRKRNWFALVNSLNLARLNPFAKTHKLYTLICSFLLQAAAKLSKRAVVVVEPKFT